MEAKATIKSSAILVLSVCIFIAGCRDKEMEAENTALKSEVYVLKNTESRLTNEIVVLKKELANKSDDANKKGDEIKRKDDELKQKNENINQNIRALKEVEDRLKEQIEEKKIEIKRKDEEIKSKDGELKKTQDEFKTFKENLSTEIKKLIEIAALAKETDNLLGTGTNIDKLKEKIAAISSKIESARQESRLEKLYKPLSKFSSNMENAIQMYKTAENERNKNLIQLEHDSPLMSRIDVAQRKYQITVAFINSKTAAANLISANCEKISVISAKMLQLSKGGQLL